MAFSLYTQSFGIGNANAKVTISEVGTGLPAIILASSTGGIVSDKGIAQIDATGNLVVYVDTSKTWKVTLVDEKYTPTTESPASVGELYGGGNAVATFADSMTDFNFSTFTPTAITFDSTTRTMTWTISSFQMPAGATFNFWHRGYASLFNMMHLTVSSYLSATQFSAVLPPGDYSDVPATLANPGSGYVNPRTLKGAKGFLSWLNAYLNQRFNIVVHSSQSGDTIKQNLARLPTEMALWKSMGVNTVVMHGLGLNSITYNSLGTGEPNDATTMVTDLRTLLDTIRLNGFRILLSTITPVATGEGKANKGAMTLLQSVNRWYAKYAQQYSDRVCLIDAYAPVINPTDANGLAKAGMLAAGDHIHLTNVGGCAIAKYPENLARVAAFFPVARSTLPMSVLDCRAASALTSPTVTVGADGVTITVTAANSNIMRNQPVFVRGCTGVYAVLNGRQISNTSTGSGVFQFTSAIPCSAPGTTATGTIVIATSRNLFPDPLLTATPTGRATLNGMTNTAVAPTLQCTTQGAVSGVGTGLTAVATVGAEPNGFGNEQLVTISAATVVGERASISFANSIGTVENQMQIGRTYYHELQLRLTSTDWNGTPISEINFAMSLTATGVNGAETWRVTDLNQYETVAPLFVPGDSLTQVLHLRTAPITIPPSSTLISCQCALNIGTQAVFNGVATLTIGVSRIATWDVTNDGVELLG